MQADHTWLVIGSLIHPAVTQAQQPNVVMQSSTPNKASNYTREATKVSYFSQTNNDCISSSSTPVFFSHQVAWQPANMGICLQVHIPLLFQ